jgi:hypothetical protein
MLTMDNINTIKNLRNNHDKSINHIAKELIAFYEMIWSNRFVTFFN